MKDYFILIPAYKPGPSMLPFLAELQTLDAQILVVNDGSGPQYDEIFRQTREMGIEVIEHAVNQGKGRALKTGLNKILLSYPEVKGVVTADCDGQHLVKDIERVLQALKDNPGTLITGGRELRQNVPFRSRLGNGIMRFLFSVASGTKLRDTQTGLRGLPGSLLRKLCTLPGEKYEYEMNMLLIMREWQVPIKEITIETVYIDNNRGSHFNTFTDSMRIGKRIFAFMFSSISAFVLDYLIYWLLDSVILVPWVWLCSALARICSSIYNYFVNKNLVFKHISDRTTMIKYFALCLFVLVSNAALADLLSRVMPSTDSRLPGDVLFFIINYYAQRDFVFKTPQKKKPEKKLQLKEKKAKDKPNA